MDKNYFMVHYVGYIITKPASPVDGIEINGEYMTATGA